MDENVQKFDDQNITSENLNEETQDIVEGKDIVVTPNDDGQTFEDVARDIDASYMQESILENKAEPFVSVRYNHKNRDFTKEEAVKFIQKGMHTESLRAKLEYLAKRQNTDINSLVEKLVREPEEIYRKRLEQLYGKDSPEVEIGINIFREKQSDEYKKIMQNDEKYNNELKTVNEINSRLANEYLMLKKEIPDAPQYSKLPNSVILEAAEGKRDLYSAYLHFLHKEKVKIEAAKKTQTAANTASSGKMGKGGEDNMSSSDRNFLLGLWSK